MKYIMCAKTYPAYHPKAGQPTGFRESILNGTKVHTLRESAGNRKSGETISLREWEGAPYRSKQAEFAQCIIKVRFIVIHGGLPGQPEIDSLSQSDGFADPVDFQHWFTKGNDEPINFIGACIWFNDVQGVRQ
jgi:hypothetical protein